MIKGFFVLAAPVLLVSGAPAFADEPVPIPPVPVAESDPARLAAARQTVDYVFPSGTYARIMNGTMDKMMDSVMDSMTQMQLKDFAGIGGMGQEELKSELGSATLSQIMEIYDPAYRDRMKVSTRAMMTEMAGLMTEFEPEIRAGSPPPTPRSSTKHSSANSTPSSRLPRAGLMRRIPS